MNQLQLANQPEKNDAFNKILRYMVEADITLSAQEEKILSRWIYVDGRLRERKFKEPVLVEMIMERFGVSKFTALNDIYQTQALFGACRRVSKKYLLIHHAEEIAMQIERYKSDRSMAHLLPKLNDSYTKALAALPEEVNKNILPPPVILLNPVAGQEISRPMTIEQAKAKLLDKLKKQSEPIDYEDEPNDPSQA